MSRDQCWKADLAIICSLVPPAEMFVSGGMAKRKNTVCIYYMVCNVNIPVYVDGLRAQQIIIELVFPSHIVIS